MPDAPNMPHALNALSVAQGFHWFAWQRDGRQFAQVRRREGDAVVGMLNRSWLYDPQAGKWVPNYSYPVPNRA